MEHDTANFFFSCLIPPTEPPSDGIGFGPQSSCTGVDLQGTKNEISSKLADRFIALLRLAARDATQLQGYACLKTGAHQQNYIPNKREDTPPWS